MLGIMAAACGGEPEPVGDEHFAVESGLKLQARLFTTKVLCGAYDYYCYEDQQLVEGVSLRGVAIPTSSQVFGPDVLSVKYDFTHSDGIKGSLAFDLPVVRPSQQAAVLEVLYTESRGETVVFSAKATDGFLEMPADSSCGCQDIRFDLVFFHKGDDGSADGYRRLSMGLLSPLAVPCKQPMSLPQSQPGITISERTCPATGGTGTGGTGTGTTTPGGARKPGEGEGSSNETGRTSYDYEDDIYTVADGCIEGCNAADGCSDFEGCEDSEGCDEGCEDSGGSCEADTAANGCEGDTGGGCDSDPACTVVRGMSRIPNATLWLIVAIFYCVHFTSPRGRRRRRRERRQEAIRRSRQR